jgi:RNA polymerase sigma factor (sigma-70 family)
MKDDSSGRLITTPFEKLLDWLNSDCELATKEYERLHKKLIAYFERRHIPGEEYADETFDRITSKLEKGEVLPAENQEHYCFGVARNLVKEFWRRSKSRSKNLESSANANDNPVAEQLNEQRQQAWIGLKDECAKDCLARLKPDQRRLLLLYYGGDEQTRARNREKLAKEFGISNEVLRVRVHRARGIVRNCYQDCLKRHGIEH